MKFYKYQGTGNDFILLDNRTREFDNLDVAKLCNRKFGIGADGLMLLQNHAEYDFEMVYYNSDGNISSMCGNGGRCIVAFAKKMKVFDGNKTLFWAIDGLHEAYIENDFVELKMIDVNSIQMIENDYQMNTGSPHYVRFNSSIDHINIIEEARKIRYNDVFKENGINVNFVEVKNNNTIKVRTYERGVEDETLSCGTGVTACAIAFNNITNPEINSVNIETPGGLLTVKFELENSKYSNVWLCGPATFVFEGEI